MADSYVTKHRTGWAVRAPGGKRASSVHSTQREAERAAKQTVRSLGGGGSHSGAGWRWRDYDTVPPGNDPNPPCDRKH